MQPSPVQRSMLALTLLGTLISTSACDGISLARNAPELDGAAVVALTGLTLPAGATVEYKRVDNGMDQMVRVVFVMPEAGWPALRDQIVPPGGDVPPFSAVNAAELGNDDGGWAPSAADGLAVVRQRWRGSESLTVGHAPAGAGRRRVWVHWFST